MHVDAVISFRSGTLILFLLGGLTTLHGLHPDDHRQLDYEMSAFQTDQFLIFFVSIDQKIECLGL